MKRGGKEEEKIVLDITDWHFCSVRRNCLFLQWPTATAATAAVAAAADR